MPKYRKKPAVVDAMRYTGGNLRELYRFADTDATRGLPAHVTIGEWLVRDDEGRWSAVDHYEFKATYEIV